MPEDDRELLHLACPIAIKESDTEEGFFVKGFASVQTVDRSGDEVPPEEFNVKSFMAKPVLLYNHRFWHDSAGNPVAIGVPRDMFVAKLVKGDDDETFKVKNLEKKEIVDTLPKERAPDLKVGAKGLWIVAEVTIPEIQKMVTRGEINAFSWRGLVKVSHKVKDDGTVQRVLTDIDLFEISLVHVPDNPQALLALAKTVEGQLTYERHDFSGPLVVHMVRLDKSRFDSIGMAREYLKGHQLQHDKIAQDSGAYFSPQKSLEEFEEKELISVRLCDGVQIVAGPMKKQEAKSDPTTLVGVVVPNDMLTQLKDWAKEQSSMSDDKDKASDGDQKDKDKKAEDTPKKDEGKADETPTTEEALQTFGNFVAEKVATSVVAGLKPGFEAMTDAMKSMGDSLKSFAEVKSGDAKDDTKADTDTDTNADKKANTDKSFNNMAGALEALAEGLTDIKKQQEDTAAKVAAVSKSVPSQPDRNETVDTDKSKDDSNDPNACFDNLWPGLTNKE